MRTVCIDLDGTLISYEKWKGEEYFASVLPGACDAMTKLHNDGWYIIIYTTRANKAIVGNFLKEHKLIFDAINENPYQPINAKGGKPLADVYVDDRGLKFNGDWEETYKSIEKFRTWEEDDKCWAEDIDYSKKFLVSDFEQTNEQIRHYDNVNWDITKFAFSQLMIVVGACWALYTAEKELVHLQVILCVILMLSGLFTALSIWSVAKNRVYFCRASRHINEIRAHALFHTPLGFSNINQYYVDINHPKAADWTSTQLICLYLLMLAMFIVFGVAGYFLCTYYSLSMWFMAIPAIFSVLFILVVFRFLYRN